MDVYAFLRAQLWLYGPLPCDTWPPHRGCVRAPDSAETRDGELNEHESDVATVILPPCRCSFILRDGAGAVGWGSNGASSKGGVPILLRRNATRKRRRCEMQPSQSGDAADGDQEVEGDARSETKAERGRRAASTMRIDSGAVVTNAAEKAPANAMPLPPLHPSGREGEEKSDLITDVSFEAAILPQPAAPPTGGAGRPGGGGGGSNSHPGGGAMLYVRLDGGVYFLDHTLLETVQFVNCAPLRPATTA
ncbi:unnamed protein product, partial [Phaeothamnion confervicola]